MGYPRKRKLMKKERDLYNIFFFLPFSKELVTSSIVWLIALGVRDRIVNEGIELCMSFH